TRPPTADARPLSRGLELCSQGHYHDALPHLTTVLRADPKNEKALFARARARVHVGEFAFAREDFLAADALTPHGRNKAGIGYCFHAEGNSPQAVLKPYQEAVQAGFAPVEVHNNMAFCYIKMNQPEEAQKS